MGTWARRSQTARLCLIAAAALALTTTAVACAGGDDTQAKEDTATSTAPSSSETAESSPRFTRSNWDLLNSDPEHYKGASVDIVGKIFLPPERDEGTVAFQMYADPKNSEWNTIVSYGDASLRLRDEDFVHVQGTVAGKYEGKNAFGAELTVPVVSPDAVRVVDATEAASPAIRTLPRKRIAQAGITITVQKVELAEDETRVFLAVNNGSSAQFSIYSFGGKAVQAGRQYESTYSSGDYPELSTEILPGAFSSGIMVFPKMRTNAGLELHLEGSSRDSDVGEYGTLNWRFRW